MTGRISFTRDEAAASTVVKEKLLVQLFDGATLDWNAASSPPLSGFQFPNRRLVTMEHSLSFFLSFFFFPPPVFQESTLHPPQKPTFFFLPHLGGEGMHVCPSLRTIRPSR